MTSRAAGAGGTNETWVEHFACSLEYVCDVNALRAFAGDVPLKTTSEAPLRRAVTLTFHSSYPPNAGQVIRCVHKISTWRTYFINVAYMSKLPHLRRYRGSSTLRNLRYFVHLVAHTKCTVGRFHRTPFSRSVLC